MTRVYAGLAAAALAGLLGGTAYTVWSTRAADQYAECRGGAVGGGDIGGAFTLVDETGKTVKVAAVAKPDRTDPSGVDIDLTLGRESSFDGYRSLHDSTMGVNRLPAGTEGDHREYPASQVGVSRSVATEELFDVQQQADFFVSLGETDKAIGVLKEHLADSQEPSALAYLDLFKLYHELNRRAEYDALRVEFNHLFNAGAPPFDQYSDDSQGLEAYETAFSRIQALWPQPRVLDVIEQSIFREANEVDGEVFDLEAYRELLLLHAMAKDMIKRDMVDSASQVDFQHTAIKPLKAAGNKGLAAAVAAALNPHRKDKTPCGMSWSGP